MTQFKKTQELPVDAASPWKDDVFETLEGYATFLTNALIADPGPFVLNVNGAWGSGKTFFVQRWAANLRNQGYPVVEFNAWENDAADDPLAPLMACFLDAQSAILPPATAERFKQTCGKYILTGGGLIVRAGLKQVFGEKGVDQINELLDKDAEGELIKLAGKHIDEQLAKQKAAKGLHELLTAFVESVCEKQGTQLPVFFFIDELDRCRPTFAIELLERVKHLFNVDGIKFIVTTDSRQLAHSICGAYGSGFDGTTYLRRFFDETFTLPPPDLFQHAKHLFTRIENQNWVNNFADGITPGEVFTNISHAFALSLRDQNQVFHRMTAVLANIENRHSVLLTYLLFLTTLRMKDPESYMQLTRREDKQPVWEEALQKTSFKDPLYRSILNWCFKYLDMPHAEASKHWRRKHEKDDSHELSEQDWIVDGIQQTIVNNYRDLKQYSKYVELASTLT